ncbi:MAG: ATPase [Alteromonadaceae bacterium]|nr:ATPase [Colwellia sp.]PCK07010.1 MAG: ATPase [Alteromonadaceae bacterium]
MALEKKKQLRNKVNYILGVDGGGTKTIARLINLTTQEQWQAVSGPSSLSNDFTGAVSVLNALIADVIGQAACQSLEVVAVFGLAGTGDPNTVAKLQQIFAHRFIALDICSDASTSAYGANNGGEVAVVALGTGSVGMRLQLSEQGELTQQMVGGWGFLIGDEGGGAKLGYHSVQALIAEFQHFGYAHSQLAQAVAAFINAKDTSVITRQKIAAWLARAKPVNFAQLSPLVTQQQSACPVAKEIIVNHIASVESLISDTRSETTLPVVLLGGLAPFTQALLSDKTKHFVISAKGDALDGACLLANIAVKKQRLAT